MTELFLIGIGTGNPDHLTRQAVKALNAVDLVMIPKKSGKADLAELRHAILAEVVTNQAVKIAEFDLPVRDAANPDYEAGVNDWHDAIAAVWAQNNLRTVNQLGQKSNSYTQLESSMSGLLSSFTDVQLTMPNQQQVDAFLNRAPLQILTNRLDLLCGA